MKELALLVYILIGVGASSHPRHKNAGWKSVVIIIAWPAGVGNWLAEKGVI
jgi:hypothetical protein